MAEKLTKVQKLELINGVFEQIINSKCQTRRVIRGQRYKLGLVSFPVRVEEAEGHGIVGVRESDGSIVSFYSEGEVNERNFETTTSLVPAFEISVSEVDEQFEYVNHPVKARNLRFWNATRILSSVLFKQMQHDLQMYAQSLC